MKRSLALVLMVLSASTAALLGVATAGPVPDGAQMAVLRYAAAEVRVVRMRGDFGVRVGTRPLFDSSGVRMSEEFGDRLSAMRIARPAGGVAAIPWQEISSIETDRGTRGRNAMLGVVVGFVVGGSIALSRIDWFSFRNQQHEGDKIIAVSVGAGALLGFLTGWRGDKRTIYPASSERGH